MGTWDVGSFDDDGALDWLGDALEEGLSTAVPTFLDNWEEESKQDFLDSYFAAETLAVAETMAIKLGRKNDFLDPADTENELAVH